MAEIKSKEIAEKNLLKGFNKDLKGGLNLIKTFNEELKKSLEIQKKIIQQSAKDTTSKGLKKRAESYREVDEAVEKINKNNKDSIAINKQIIALEKKILEQNKKRIEEAGKLNNTQRERLKLEKQLKEANSSSIDDNNIIKVQLQEQRKVNKDLAKDKLGLIGAYEKESKKLNGLRKKYKNLAVQNKQNTKEGRNLLKNITKLDSKLKDVDDAVGQNQRSVGKYSKALEGLNATIGKLGIIALITKAFQVLGDVFGDNREGALEMSIAMSTFTETAKVFVNSVVTSLGGIKELFSAIGDSMDIVVLKMKIAVNEIALALPFSDTERIEGFLKTMNEQLLELEKSSVSDSIDKIVDAFDGIGETTSIAIDEQKKFLTLQLKIRIQIEQQEKALAGLAEKRQILQDISDDDTLGFVTRAKALKEAQSAAANFARLENRLALTKEKLTVEAVKQDLRRISSEKKKQIGITEATIDAIKSGEALRRLLGDADIARQVSDTNDQAFTDAFVERRAKEVEAESFRRDQEEKFRKTERDAFEQENDILTEFTEQKIAANDKIINSDKATLKERQNALASSQKLEKELFENSINLILEQGKASIDILKDTIDLRIDLTAKEKEEEKLLLDKRKALLTNAAIQKILNEENIVSQGILIRSIDLGEIEEKVLKDTLKIRKDLILANAESLKVEQETALKTKELLEDIALQEQVLAGEKVDLDDERLENEKDNLQARIDILKEDSIKRLELQVELNDLEIDEEQRKNDALLASDQKLQDDREAIQDARLESVNNVAGILGELADDESKAAEAIKQLKKLLAIAEIGINTERAVSAIRAEKDISEVQRRSRILAARTGGALSAVKVAAFEKGGLVEGKEQLVRINEKGQEFVLDAQTTKAAGLDKKGSDMSSFHERFGNSLSMSPHAFKSLETGNVLNPKDVSFEKIIKSQEENTNRIIQSQENNATKFEMFQTGAGQLATMIQKGNNKNIRIYEPDPDTL